MDPRFWKYFIILPAAFLLMIWIAGHFGGTCSILPVVLAITVFMTAMALFVGETLQNHTQRSTTIIVSVFSLIMFGIAVNTATNTSDHIKKALQISDIGSQVGLTTGHVTWSSIFTYRDLPDRKKAPNYKYYNFEPAGCTVHYSYVVDGETYKQCDLAYRLHFKKGEALKVIYRVANPRQARMVHQHEKLPTWAMSS